MDLHQQTIDLHLYFTQLLATVDNIREKLSEALDEDETPWSADVISRLGVLVCGLTADDIKSFPMDSELLSIIEMLSVYEDLLDGSQVIYFSFDKMGS